MEETNPVHPNNYALIGLLCTAFGTLATLLINYLIQRNKSSTTVKVEEIKADVKEAEKIQRQLDEAVATMLKVEEELEQVKEAHKDEILELNKEVTKKDTIITEYLNLLKHFKVLVSILYQQLPDDIKNNEANMAVLDHLKQAMDDVNVQ